MKPNVTTVRQWLACWSSLGSQREVEDIPEDMSAAALRIGAEAALSLVETLLLLDHQESELVDVMQEFLEVYARCYPGPFVDAILARMKPNSSPIPVDAIEYAGLSGCVARLRPLLDLQHADEELLTSLVSVLGTVGGDAARELLLELRSRPQVSSVLEREIRIALDAIERQHRC